MAGRSWRAARPAASTRGSGAVYAKGGLHLVLDGPEPPRSWPGPSSEEEPQAGAHVHIQIIGPGLGLGRWARSTRAAASRSKMICLVAGKVALIFPPR